MEMGEAVEALGALAQETRLAIYRRLVRQGPDGLAAGRIAEALRLPAPTLSFHLAQLAHVGLVKSRRAGRSIVYAADYESMRRLLAFLTQCCCEGQPEDARRRRGRPRRKGRR
jgi:ArsR family transcriptional regulator